LGVPVLGAAPDAASIDLSEPAFWERPRRERDEAFALMRREAPVSWQEAPRLGAPTKWGAPRGHWAVTRHEDVVAVSRDAKTFCAGRGTMLFDNLSPDDEYAYSGFLSMDAPRHSQLRRLVSKAFTPRTMRVIEGQIRDQARLAVSAVAERGGCDFLHDLVGPFPIGVIGDMMGVPASDRPEIQRLVDITVQFGNDEYAPTFDDSIQAARDVAAYGLTLASERRARPTDDLTSTLVQAEVDGRRLSEDDIGAFFWLLMSAGTETTATTAAHGMLALTRNPSERARWQADFDAMAPTAVEELLRWATPLLNFRRVATTDTEVAGQAIAEGDNVIVWYVSANRDEAVFAEPYRFDLGRAPNSHVAFGGGGPHFCLGSALARIELRALFSELFARLPDIEISGEPVPLPNPFLETYQALPCSFTPAEAG
jgi:cytochrome P450